MKWPFSRTEGGVDLVLRWPQLAHAPADLGVDGVLRVELHPAHPSLVAQLRQHAHHLRTGREGAGTKFTTSTGVARFTAPTGEARSLE